MLTTLAFIALTLGIVLVAIGYTVDGRTLRPGWGLVILALVLALIAYLIPAAG